MITAIACIATTVWLEARGEPLDGMAAVADVIMVRAARRDLSPCDVVQQNGQFATGAVDLEYLDETERAAWDQARQIAAAAYHGHGLGINADYFHADSVSPDWANKMQAVGRIGDHVFYDGGTE